MEEMLLALLEETGALDEGWDVYDGDLLECPCGNVIELDGRCPNGCVSPLRMIGAI